MSGTKTRTLYGVIILLVALVIIASSVAGLYYYQYTMTASENSTYASQLKALGIEYSTDILVGYGNGTWHWYNNTKVAPGSNLYGATFVATGGNLNSTCCEYGSHFVTGINGIRNNSTVYWWVWTYFAGNSTAPWQTAPVGPDQLPILNDTEVFAWTYCGSTAAGNPACTPT